MGKFKKGEIVLVPFPFSQGNKVKNRPALVVATLPYGDIILVQVTKMKKHPDSIKIEKRDFLKGSLKVTSYVRPGKIFVPHESLIFRKVALLQIKKMQEVTDKIIEILTR